MDIIIARCSEVYTLITGYNLCWADCFNYYKLVYKAANWTPAESGAGADFYVHCTYT